MYWFDGCFKSDLYDDRLNRSGGLDRRFAGCVPVGRGDIGVYCSGI